MHRCLFKSLYLQSSFINQWTSRKKVRGFLCILTYSDFFFNLIVLTQNNIILTFAQVLAILTTFWLLERRILCTPDRSWRTSWDRSGAVPMRPGSRSGRSQRCVTLGSSQNGRIATNGGYNRLTMVFIDIYWWCTGLPASWADLFPDTPCRYLYLGHFIGFDR